MMKCERSANKIIEIGSFTLFFINNYFILSFNLLTAQNLLTPLKKKEKAWWMLQCDHGRNLVSYDSLTVEIGCVLLPYQMRTFGGGSSSLWFWEYNSRFLSGWYLILRGDEIGKLRCDEWVSWAKQYHSWTIYSLCLYSLYILPD